MRIPRKFLASVAGFLTGTASAVAQNPLPAAPTVPLPTVSAVGPVAPPSYSFTDAPDCGPRIWGSAEYLLWWSKDAPVPVPLVTTGPVTPNLTPVLGQPGTSVLIGGNGVDLGLASGGRFTLGGWLNRDRTLGLEGSYLFLGKQSTTQSVGSSAAPGSAFLALPFLDATTGGESSTRIAVPGAFSGVASLAVSSSLQSGELNGLFNVIRRDNWNLSVIAGFRYLNLQEQLAFATSSPSIVGPADVFTTLDQFNTSNDFYGGQIGARFERQFGRFFLNATGKVAFGSMHQTVATAGQLVTNDFNGFGIPQVFPGGYLTQPTNIGRQNSDRFAVLTDVTANVGYQVTRSARVFVGYSLLHLSDVVRPGDQIDRRINPSQAPAITGVVPAVPTGPAAPLPQFNRSTFWAQGVNFGLQFRY